MVVRYVVRAGCRARRICDRQPISGHAMGRAVSAIEDTAFLHRAAARSLPVGRGRARRRHFGGGRPRRDNPSDRHHQPVCLLAAGACGARGLVLAVALALGAAFGLASRCGIGASDGGPARRAAFPQFEQRLLTFTERDRGVQDPFLELLAADTMRVAQRDRRQDCGAGPAVGRFVCGWSRRAPGALVVDSGGTRISRLWRCRLVDRRPPAPFYSRAGPSRRCDSCAVMPTNS